MDRGGGPFAPRGRFWRPGGGSRSSPSSSGSTDPRTHTPVGAEPTSCDRISGDTRSTVYGSGERFWHSDERFSAGRQRSGQSQPVAYKAGDTHSPVGGSGGRSWHRDERSSSGRQRSGQSQQAWKTVQPVAYKASAGRGSPLSNSRDNKTDCVVGSKESCQGNVRPGNEKSRQWYKDCKTAQPVATEASSAHGCSLSTDRTDLEVGSPELNYRLEIVGSDSTQSDLSFVCAVDVLKPVKHEKVSADGPLDLDQSLMKNLGSQGEKSDAEQFDICPPKKAGAHIVLNQSLLEVNKERRKQIKDAQGPKRILIRSGMVLLKNYISVVEQVNIVNECRKLGLGTGGFYQPGYRDGAKLNLNMMCLGKNWDPETRRYEEIRPVDGAKPPPIPLSFLELVKKSLEESLTLIAEECKSTGRAKDMLPWMSPDICLVNFYSTSGRLGLHQDRDESEESLRRGLPVVSISIGDSAEFLYGDQRDVDKAEKVTLESGDVLIFGGDSRHVFHGVSSIQPNTAPKPLVKDTNLRPGRLNLTFRKY